MKQTGRPKKSDDVAKSLLLQVRITIDERRAFQDAAEVAGIDLSAWVRERLRLSAARELQEVNRSIAFLATP